MAVRSEERKWPAAARFAPFLLIIAGFAWRMLWLSRQAEFLTQGEAPNVAATLARGGGIANAFGVGTGPTAHITPAQPFVASAVYQMFGVESVASGWVLSIIACSYVLAAAGIFYAATARLGWSRGARLLGLAMFCLLPVQPHIETMEFRTWEGGLAALLGAAMLYLIVRCDALKDTSLPAIIAACLLAAVIFYVSPPLGLVAYVNLLILGFRRLKLPQIGLAAVCALLCLAVVLTPWIVRNERAFGQFIPLRSNFGLEFALANNPAAAATDDANRTFDMNFKRIHPIANPAALAELVRVGEPAYSQRLSDQTKRWIGAHPADFAKLSALHVLHYYFPVEFPGSGSVAKRLMTWAISLLGLFGAGAALFVWRGRSVYLAVAAIVPAVPYALVHPDDRYHYVVDLPLMFLAGALIGALLNLRRGRDETDRRASGPLGVRA